MKRINILLLIVLLIISYLANAQMSGKGQIITVQGDTVEGYILIEKKNFYDVVKFKKNKEDRFEKMALSNLYRIVLKDKVYENLFLVKGDVQGGRVYTCKLCLCVVDGFVKLYKESVNMFYHGAEGIVDLNKKKSEETYYIVKGSQQAEEIHPKFFVKQTQNMFIDYKMVAQSIKEKKYGYSDIKKIVEDCNQSYYSSILEEY